jgi:DNA polymerase III delta subunit
MKEHRELQTLIDELERHIIQQDKLIQEQKKLTTAQDEKIINLAFDLEYERHTNSLKGQK